MKIVVIGTGFGERVVAPAYRALECDVRVVSTRDSEAIRSALADAPDLVSVHSPPFLHKDHVFAALAAGAAVLCDKPFGRDAAEAQAMRDRAEEAGAFHFLNFEFRHQPARMHVRRMHRDGTIGALRHVSWTFIGSGLRDQTHRWLFDAEQSGGWIGAYGSHVIDTLRWLFDDEIAACGGISRIETPIRPDPAGIMHASTAEDAFTAWFTMARGGTVSFDTAYSATVNLPHRLILLGSEGSIELVDERVVTVRRPDAEPETTEFPPPPGDPHDAGLRSWLADVIGAVRDRRQVRPSFDDGVAVAEVMDRLRATLIRTG